jgi:excisionase family DNA binding protein
MPGSDDGTRLQTIKDAARMLKISAQTIYRLGQRGELELIKVGARTRVTQASIDHYIDNAKRVVPKPRK